MHSPLEPIQEMVGSLSAMARGKSRGKWYPEPRMSPALTILPGRRTLDVTPGTTIPRAAHAAGIDITATCGGRGRCTSCRIKFVAGTIPPPTIMDEVQLGHDPGREGYRLPT